MSSKRHVTMKEADAVADFVGNLLEALHMPAWRVLIMDKPCEEDSFATINPIDGVWTAELFLCEGWMKVDYDRRREVITHEVLHLLHFQVNHVVHEAKDYMHDHEHEGLWNRYQMACEYMVDHLAMWMADTHSLSEAWDKAHGKA